MALESVVNLIRPIPGDIEIALQAGKKGNFRMARQVLRTAVEQLDFQEDNPQRLIELTIYMADTYLNQKRYNFAKTWYAKALHGCQRLTEINTLQEAMVMSRLAQIHVLQKQLDEFQKCFTRVEHIYLLSMESDFSALLSFLIDLSWTLCTHERLFEAKSVNNLIFHIKQLDEAIAV